MPQLLAEPFGCVAFQQPILGFIKRGADLLSNLRSMASLGFYFSKFSNIEIHAIGFRNALLTVTMAKFSNWPRSGCNPLIKYG